MLVCLLLGGGGECIFVVPLVAIKYFIQQKEIKMTSRTSTVYFASMPSFSFAPSVHFFNTNELLFLCITGFHVRKQALNCLIHAAETEKFINFLVFNAMKNENEIGITNRQVPCARAFFRF
jgi:hypothetical protein